MGSRRIALVNMPLSSFSYPSIQLGILKSILESRDYKVTDKYLNINFAKQVDFNFYLSIINTAEILLGDWLFSKLAFGIDPQHEYLDKALPRIRSKHLKRKDISLYKKTLKHIRDNLVPKWIDDEIEGCKWDDYDIVGFSCTFSQLVPSICLARRIKKQSPEVTIVFGGSSLEGQMGQEILKQVKDIDYLVAGEGENAFIDVLNDVFEGESRFRKTVVTSSIKTDLNTLPCPDYDTYYNLIREEQELNKMEDAQKIGIALYETSRGCWWGEKHHCKFCGLNGKDMKFRNKDPEKIVSDFDHILNRYQRYDIRLVDNILSNNFYSSLLPTLRDLHTSFNLYSEVKPNMDKNKIMLLSKVGINVIQPGIESINSKALKLLNKGVKAYQNLELLRWSQVFRVDINWHFLYKIPGESQKMLEEQIALLPLIVHLQPPMSISKIRLDRFSPFFKEHFVKQKKIFQNVRPSEFYNYCFPSSWNIQNICFYFESESITSVKMETYKEFERLCQKWINLWKNFDSRPKLILKRGVSIAHIIDTRFGSDEVIEVKDEFLEIVLGLLDGPKSLSWLQSNFAFDNHRIKEVITELVKNKLVINIDERYLFLPVPEKYNL